MNHVVLDANVCLDWLLPGSKLGSADYANAFAAYLNSQNVTLHVPIHFDLEVTGPLLKVFRAKTPGITEKALNAALEAMDSLPLNFHASGLGFRQTTDMARAYNLSIYDTPYFNLARAFGYALATSDRGLLSAAKAWGVEVWAPGA